MQYRTVYRDRGDRWKDPKLAGWSASHVIWRIEGGRIQTELI